MDARNGMRPIHPGEILREELDDLGLSASALSKALDVPVNRVTLILREQRSVTADTALRLARYFGTTPELWLNLQKTWELRRAEIESGHRIAERVKPRHTAELGQDRMAQTKRRLPMAKSQQPNRWNDSFGFVREDGTPLDPNTPPETLVELAAQRARAEEITRQEMEKEKQRESRRRRKGKADACS